MLRSSVQVTVTFLAAWLIASAASAQENAPPEMSPQLRQAVQELDANGKQLTVILEKTLPAMRERLLTIQPDQLNEQAAAEQVEKLANPLLTALEVTGVHTALAVLEKGLSGPADPRAPLALALMSGYFNLEAHAQSKSWVEIATENGVKPGQLQNILKGLFGFAAQ